MKYFLFPIETEFQKTIKKNWNLVKNARNKELTIRVQHCPAYSTQSLAQFIFSPDSLAILCFV